MGDRVCNAVCGHMRLPRLQRPLSRIEERKERITVRREVNFGDDGPSGVVERGAIDLTAPSDEYLGGFACENEGVLERGRTLASGARPVAVSGQHNRSSSRERSTDGLEGSPAHHQHMAKCGRLEVSEVLRKVPGKRVVQANHTIGRAGHD